MPTAWPKMDHMGGAPRNGDTPEWGRTSKKVVEAPKLTGKTVFKKLMAATSSNRDESEQSQPCAGSDASRVEVSSENHPEAEDAGSDALPKQTSPKRTKRKNVKVKDAQSTRHNLLTHFPRDPNCQFAVNSRQPELIHVLEVKKQAVCQSQNSLLML